MAKRARQRAARRVAPQAQRAGRISGPAPKLSIVVPAYNRPEMLLECLRSLESVTTDCEIVVIDDNSPTDLSQTVADQAARDPRIRFLRNPRNLGTSATFNLCLQEARGQYVCLLGDDDSVLPGNFEKKVGILDAHSEIGLVYSQWYVTDEHGRNLGVRRWPGLIDYSYLGGRQEFLDLLCACYMSLHSIVFRRELWQRFGGFDERLTRFGNDWDMMLRYCFHAQTAFIAEPLLNVRDHPGSVSRTAGLPDGEFAACRMAVWRKWLVDSESPPVLDEPVWQRMHQAFTADLRYELATEPARIEDYLRQLATLKEEHVAKVSRRLTRALPGVTPACHSERRAKPALERSEGNPHLPEETLRSTLRVTSSGERRAKSPSDGRVGDASLDAQHDSMRGDKPLAPPVLWSGLIFNPSGYASQLRSSARALHEAGVRVRLEELRPDVSIDMGFTEAEQRLYRQLLDTPLPKGERHLRIWDAAPHMFAADPDALAIVGKTVFETDRLPADWVEACNGVDMIWVSSPFNVDSFSRSGVAEHKLRWVPQCCDTSRFSAGAEPVDLDTGRSFNFLSIFEWIPRKGWDVLIRAFVEEFKADEDVGLVMQGYTTLGLTPDDIARDIRTCVTAAVGDAATPPIRFRGGVISEASMPALYRASGAYVQPHRGEGWGRTLMEAMASGLPTIGTRWSAPLTFMNDDNSYLVDCQVVDVPDEVLRNQPYYGGHRWAEPSVEHLRALMREVFQNREQARQRGLRAAADVAARYSPDAVGVQLRSLCEEAAELFGKPSPKESRIPFASLEGRLRSAQNDKLQIPVAWEGTFFETHSLGLVNRELALALLRTGEIDLGLRLRQLEPLRFDPSQDARLAPLLARVDKPFDGQPAVHIRHAWPPVFERPAAGKWVMIQPWEYGRLPVDWVGPMRDLVDEVWAYGSAVKQFYVDSGVPAEKVHVVPLGINPDLFRPDVAPASLPTQKQFRFLFVGGSIWRKGIDLLLEAYRRTFTRADDVCLVIKDMGQDSFYKGQGAAETIGRLQADPRAPEILYVTQSIPDSGIAGLYTACQCLVHPYRGEGFGLPVAEAMACGLPVIVTKGGATDDFCTDDRAFRVPSQKAVMNINLPTAGEPWVLEPDLEALGAFMRAAYDSPQAIARKGAAAAEWTRRNLTWDAAAKVALGRLQALTGADPQAAALAAFETAKQHLAANSLPDAERELARAVALNPRLAGAKYLLGCVLLQQDKPAESLSVLHEAVELMPDVSDFHNGLGTALQQLSRHDQAVEAFERALALDPANANAWLNLAESQTALGKQDSARAALARARQLDPDAAAVAAGA